MGETAGHESSKHCPFVSGVTPPSGPGSGKLKSRVTLAVSSFSRVLCWVLSQA